MKRRLLLLFLLSLSTSLSGCMMIRGVSDSTTSSTSSGNTLTDWCAGLNICRLSSGASVLPSLMFGADQSTYPVMAADNSKLFFISYARNLDPNFLPRNGDAHLYMRDMTTGVITLISTDSNGVIGNASIDTQGFDLSPDGTKVVFSSMATNMIATDNTPAASDIYLKDLTTGAVTLVSSSSARVQGNGNSYKPRFSPDGNKVVFLSDSDNLVAASTGGIVNVFAKNLNTHALVLVSADAGGTPDDSGANTAQFSPDGTKIIFDSYGTNLVAGDTNGLSDVFIKTLAGGAIVRVSTDSVGSEADGGSFYPSFSPDGTKVVFQSSATNLIGSDTNSVDDIYVKTIANDNIIRVSVDSLGAELDNSSYYAKFSPDGSSILFLSDSSNAVAGDTNTTSDVFIVSLAMGGVTRINLNNSNAQYTYGTSGAVFTPDGLKVLIETTEPVDNVDFNGASDIYLKTLGSVSNTPMTAFDDSGEGNGMTAYYSSFSPDGTKIAFISKASNLVAGDTNKNDDVFVRDFNTGVTTLISKSAAGVQGNGNSVGTSVAFSPDGSKVAFISNSSNLVAGDTNNTDDVFVVDIASGAVDRVSGDSADVEGNGTCIGFAVFSHDGTKIVFSSRASNLVAGDTNGTYDVFVKDLVTRTVTRVSTSSAGVEANNMSFAYEFSPDGTQVLMISYSSNLIASDTNATNDLFIKNLIDGSVTRISTNSTGVEGNSGSSQASFSPDGTKVLFASNASNLVAGDTNGAGDQFIKDLLTGTTTLVSTSQAGVQGNFDTNTLGHFSPDGTKIYFPSMSNNLVAGDTNGSYDIFIKDLTTGEVKLVSTDANGVQGDFGTSYPIMSPDGDKILFNSVSLLTPNDRNGTYDVFIKVIP